MSNKEKSLTGKKVVIIGGSSGMGLATAKLVVKEGGTALIAGRNQEKLDRAKKEIDSDVITKVLDARNEGDVKQFFDHIGPFDHLVTPGSKTSPGSCVATDSLVAKESFDSKFWGQYYAVKYGAPHINKGGSIVLFSGIFSHRPAPNTAIMASVNGAIEALGRALAIELAPIRVNVIVPGYVDTPLFSNMKDSDREKLFCALAKQLPVGRVGHPEDISHTILYLLTNGYITASTMCVDGGYLLV